MVLFKTSFSGLGRAAKPIEPVKSRCSPSRVRSIFAKYDADFDGLIAGADLARAWASKVERRLGRALSVTEKKLVAASVENFLRYADLDRDGMISADEWLHHALMATYPPGGAAQQAVGSGIRDSGADLRSILKAWEDLDVDHSGLVTVQELTKTCPDADYMLEVMQTDNRVTISYAEFCAHQVGLEFADVELWFYDLSKSLAKYLSPVILGSCEEGIWHTSVVVYSTEFFYFGTIQTADPGTTPFGTPQKKMQLGRTLWPSAQFLRMIEEKLDARYQPEYYDALEHNCNHCCDEMILFLLGRHIPNSARLLSERLMQTTAARALRPILNRYLGKGKLLATEADGSPQDGECEDRPRRRVLSSPPEMEVCASFGMTDWISLKDEFSTHDFVLFHAPTSVTPVVAHVLRKHADGAADVSWFTERGCQEIATKVSAADLRPCRLDDGEEDATASMSVYLKAFAAISKNLDDDMCGACSVSATPVSMMTSLDSSCKEPPALSVSPTCPTGHALVAAKLSFWQGHCQRRECQWCMKPIRRQDVRMVCGKCSYIVCSGCWASRCEYKSRVPDTFGGMPSGSVALQCPKNHALERLSGQVIRGEASCNKCERTNLGATSSCFFSCRACDYDLCMACAKLRAEDVVDQAKHKPSKGATVTI